MPTIDTITQGGIKIDIYNGEHPPPHIHALYNEYEVLVVILTSKIYAGELPNAQHRMVVKWLETGDNRENALTIFNALNPHLIRKVNIASKKKNKKTKK